MSQQASQSTVIDGIRYTVRHLTPDDAIDLLVDVTKAFGPALAGAFRAGGTAIQQGAAGLLEGNGAELSPDASRALEGALQQALLGLVGAADKATYRRIVDTLMKVTTAQPEGDPMPMPLEGQGWRLHFAGKFRQLLQVTAFGLRVNYASFFGGIGSIRTWAAGPRKPGTGTTPAPAA